MTGGLVSPALRIVVLISGRGTNLKAVIDAIASGAPARRTRGGCLQRTGLHPASLWRDKRDAMWQS